jgi:hypothetical protein
VILFWNRSLIFLFVTAADPLLPAYSSGGSGSGGGSTGGGNDDDENDDDDDAINFSDDDYQVCDFSLTFTDLDALNSAASGLRVECIQIYALDTLINMLNTAYSNYTSVNDGYDEEFDNYVTYIQKLVPAMLDNSFMFDQSKTTESMEVPASGDGLNCTSLPLAIYVPFQ